MLKAISIAALALLLAWLFGVFPDTPRTTNTAANTTSDAAAPAKPSTTNSAPTPAPPQERAQAKPKVALIDKSPAKQKGRQDLIKKLIAERVFLKTDTPGSLPRVYVGPAFYALDFDTKQGFISVVYAYHFDGSNELDLVKVMDGRTNKEIGIYALPPYGRGLDLH